MSRQVQPQMRGVWGQLTTMGQFSLDMSVHLFPRWIYLIDVAKELSSPTVFLEPHHHCSRIIYELGFPDNN